MIYTPTLPTPLKQRTSSTLAATPACATAWIRNRRSHRVWNIWPLVGFQRVQISLEQLAGSPLQTCGRSKATGRGYICRLLNETRATTVLESAIKTKQHVENEVDYKSRRVRIKEQRRADKDLGRDLCL